jgi:hypothetical protein
MASVREIVEGVQEQGEAEEIVYTFDAANIVGGAPSTPSVVVLDEDNDFEDVTADTTTGTASVMGTVITSPTIHSLTAEHTYRVEISFTIGGQQVVHYMRIDCKR